MKGEQCNVQWSDPQKKDVLLEHLLHFCVYIMSTDLSDCKQLSFLLRWILARDFLLNFDPDSTHCIQNIMRKTPRYIKKGKEK